MFRAALKSKVFVELNISETTATFLIVFSSEFYDFFRFYCKFYVFFTTSEESFMNIYWICFGWIFWVKLSMRHRTLSGGQGKREEECKTVKWNGIYTIVLMLRNLCRFTETNLVADGLNWGTSAALLRKYQTCTVLNAKGTRGVGFYSFWLAGTSERPTKRRTDTLHVTTVILVM